VHERRLVLLFVAIYLIWGFTYVAVRIALRDAAPFTLAFGRATLATALLTTVAVLSRRPAPRGRRAHAFIALVGVLNVSGLAGLMSLGLATVPAGEASLITYTQPLQVALLSRLLLGERLAPRQLLGLLVGFGGMVVVLLPRLTGGVASPIGYAALLLGAFSWGLSAVIFRWGGRPGSGVPKIDVLWLSALQAAYGAVPLFLAGLALEGLRVRWTLELLWSGGFSGLMAGGVANLLWFHLLTRRSATVVAAYVFLVPAFAVFFGGVVLGEPLTINVALGGLLTLAGIALVTRAPAPRPG
jgi:drug/metabolite transporter (DMT)-like permease